MTYCTLSIVGTHKWSNDFSYFCVWKAVPKSIRTYDNSFVLRCKVTENLQFGLCCNSYATCDQITDASGHGKTRNLFVLQPDARWSEELRLHILPRASPVARIHHFRRYSRGFNPSSSCMYTLGLVWKLRLVIPTELREVVVALTWPIWNIAIVFWDQNCSWVSAVSAENHIVVENSHHACCSAQHGVDSGLFHSLLRLDKCFFNLEVSDLEILITQPEFVVMVGLTRILSCFIGNWALDFIRIPWLFTYLR